MALDAVHEGNCLREQGNLEAALQCFKMAMSLDAECAEAYNYSAVVYFLKGMLAEAEACYGRALELRSDYAEALSNMANLLNVQGKISESYNYYSRALEIRPDLVHARSNFLLSMNYNPDVTQEEIYLQSLKWEQCHLGRLKAMTRKTSKCLNRPGKLRIGYVSPDFRTHSVSYFIEPLLRAHDRNKYEIFCYSDVTCPDNVTCRLKAICTEWRDIARMTDYEVISQIIDDEIQILIDMTGHTGKNRLSVFMAKPAPVQVSWLGYPNTTGLSSMDYRLSDKIADPEGESDRWYTERIVRLKHGFLCYAPPIDAPPVVNRPFYKNGFITFGSFNSLPKLSPLLISVWSQILIKVENSSLLLKSRFFTDTSLRENYLNQFSLHGIKRDRIKLLSAEPDTKRHLEKYSEMDIALDTFPYNGTTTTCEALWMGVPVVTICGNRHAGRVGASILHRVGLNALIANDIDAYVDIAISLANDHKYFSKLSRNMRWRVLKSPLCDSGRFAYAVEKEFTDMWSFLKRNNISV